MRKVEAQHRNTQNQSPAKQSNRGLAMASPHGEQIAQLEAMIEASPQLSKLAHVAAMVKNSPQATAQRRMMNMIHNSPRMTAQRKAIAVIHKNSQVTVQRLQPDTGTVAQRNEAPAKPNNAGLPDNLKNGIESMSSMTMDNVRVHYNSSQPVRLNNHRAYVASPNLAYSRSNAPGKAQIQMKKEPKIDEFDDKNKPDGTTSTKVIKQKDGSIGLFKYEYINSNIIDSFNKTNIADPTIANNSKYKGFNAPNISVAVTKHDLAQDYGNGKLTENQIQNGTRSIHFAHADKAHNIDREDKYTWHHLQEKGKMELIDMNVHGAMWHYGGISGWNASLHKHDSDDDPSPG